MAPVSGARSGLRTRCKQDTRPLEQLSNGERGLRAAQDILRGELSLRAAMNHYAVSYSTAGYYKEKLEQSGYGECLEASAAAARASEACSCSATRQISTHSGGFAVVCKGAVGGGLLPAPLLEGMGEDRLGALHQVGLLGSARE